jgi:hypothetical protein
MMVIIIITIIISITTSIIKQQEEQQESRSTYFLAKVHNVLAGWCGSKVIGDVLGSNCGRNAGYSD